MSHYIFFFLFLIFFVPTSPFLSSLDTHYNHFMFYLCLSFFLNLSFDNSLKKTSITLLKQNKQASCIFFFNIKLEAQYNFFLIFTKQLQSFGIMQSPILVSYSEGLWTSVLPYISLSQVSTCMRTHVNSGLQSTSTFWLTPSLYPSLHQ